MSELTDKEKAEIKILGKLMAQGIYSYIQQQQLEKFKLTDPEKASEIQKGIDKAKAQKEEERRDQKKKGIF